MKFAQSKKHQPRLATAISVTIRISGMIKKHNNRVDDICSLIKQQRYSNQ